MSKYFIYVAESKYQGLFGVENFIVDEYNSIEDAYNDASVCSEELMMSYDDIINEIQEDAEYYCNKWYGENYTIDQYDEVFYDLILENKCYIVYKIKDEITESVKDLETKACQMGVKLFVEKYCYPEAL